MRSMRTTKRMLVTLSAAALAVAMIAAPASARGPSPDRLEQAGWFCFEHFVIHCLPNGGEGVLTGHAESSLIMTWGTDTQEVEFWGTELLIHEDLYNGQPCPQDPFDGGEPGAYIHVSDLGLPLPYFVCHHFDSPFT